MNLVCHLVVASLLVQYFFDVDASIPMTVAEEQVAVDVHNTVRRREGASNMQIMVWDDTLAVIAQNWSDVCTFEHGLAINSSTLGSLDLGQNLFAGQPGPSVNLTSAILAWYNEKVDYVFDKATCNAGKQCGHYTQVVWATSNRVGCGYTACPFLKGVNWSNAVILTCIYAPAGNYVGVKPFLKGPACSQCDSGQFYCNNGLCDSSCTETSDICQCQAACKNCGNTTDTCRCQCGVGWWGVDCSQKCANTNPNCGANPGWPSSWCDSAHKYVLDSCPVLCNECVAGSPGACASASVTTAVFMQLVLTSLIALFLVAFVS